MDPMKELYSKRIIFVGGKGGVGKSTSASALSLAFAQSGKKTLLVSTDPAHNIGDIFHKDVGHKKTMVAENLWALEINPEQESKKYIGTVKNNLKGLVKATMIDEVHRQIDMASVSPGADEAALFDRIIAIILKEKEDFDKIIFDTAPTGHTVRLLSLPELMGVWIDGLLERRKKINNNYSQLLNDGEVVEDPIYEVLQERKIRFANVRDILLDSQQTGFIFVLIPERLPIIETEKAIKQLANHKLHIKTLIVNKVIPEHADGDFLQKRKQQEKEYLRLMKDKFQKQELIHIPLYENDVSDIEKLVIFAEHLNNAITEVK
jgi:arsenite-transporting ATPase